MPSKIMNTDPGIKTNPNSANVDFCNTSLDECNPRHPDSDPKIIRKNNLEISMKSSLLLIHRYPRSFRMGPINQLKIKIIQAWSSTCPFLYSPMSQARPRIVPGPPKDPKWTHQPCQMTHMGTKNLRYVCKNAKNPASRSQRASTYLSREIECNKNKNKQTNQ